MARLIFVALAMLAACGHGANYQAVPIGSPCKHDSDCGTTPFKCLLPANGYPNGYCTEGCSTGVSNGTDSEGTCPADSACISNSCRRVCVSEDAECRASEGYVCVDGNTTGVSSAHFCDIQP